MSRPGRRREFLARKAEKAKKKTPWVPVTHTAEYAVYMDSLAWSERREITLSRDGQRCRACRMEDRITPATHVHHISYQLVFHEPVKDLLSLCAPCHEAEHRDHNLRRREPFWRENTSSMIQKSRGRRAATAPAPRRLRPLVPPAPEKGLEGGRGDHAPTEETSSVTLRGCSNRPHRQVQGGASRLEHSRPMPQLILPARWLWEEALPVSQI